MMDNQEPSEEDDEGEGEVHQPSSTLAPWQAGAVQTTLWFFRVVVPVPVPTQEMKEAKARQEELAALKAMWETATLEVSECVRECVNE